MPILGDFLDINCQNSLCSNESLQKYSLNGVNHEEKLTTMYQTMGLEKLTHYIELSIIMQVIRF